LPAILEIDLGDKKMSILQKTHFSTPPIMFAAWTGAGNVGVLAVDYIRRKLNSHLFAQIDMSRFITPDSIVVNEGVAHFPDTPQSVFYHCHNPDLIIFESNAHAGGTHDEEVMKAIIDLAAELATPRIYTAAAIPQSISHTTSPGVLYACSNIGLKNELEGKDLQAMPDGIISGLNGLLLGFAQNKSIDAVCLLASIPAYASGLTYPRAAVKIVEKFSTLTGIEVDTGDLMLDAEASDPMFAEIEEKLKEFFSSGVLDTVQDQSFANVESDQKKNLSREEIPGFVMDRIENLFRAAQRDHSKAPELKTELDKWGLYKYYEDRFLDLFENEGD
jgi:predicted ATP-grasp superfamily ATP-dependent carboligase